MKAPEKIYIQSFYSNEEDAIYFDDVWTEEPEPGQENIEYTRTDAFIEKACKYLEPIIFSMNLGDRPDTDKFIDDFRKYMKGE